MKENKIETKSIVFNSDIILILPAFIRLLELSKTFLKMIDKIPIIHIQEITVKLLVSRGF